MERQGVALRLEDGPRNLDDQSANGRGTRKHLTYVLKKESDLGGNMDELLVPEVVLDVAEQLDERDERSPWVGTVNQESLQQDSRHDLSELVDLHLMEEVQHQGTEPVRMRVRVTQVEDHGAQEVVLTYEDIRRCAISGTHHYAPSTSRLVAK